MIGLEIVPIGALLALLAEQAVATALVAKDVVFEKESFKVLSKYLCDIEPVLRELQLRNLNDSQAVRQALENLKSDMHKAKELVDKYKDRSRFYLLIKCRQIVNEVQDVTRDIGRSLAGLSLASSDVLSDMSEKVRRLHHEMQKVEFEASQTQVRIVEKLQQGLKEHKTDQGFANDLLEEIARAVGVSVEPAEISKELSSFKREKEEAAAQKERAEECFLEQVISLLSRADNVDNEEELEMIYHRRMQTVEFMSEDDSIPPFRSFFCPIGEKVMIDPVSLCTGTTFERSCIQAWIDGGHGTDPSTGQTFDDITLRANVRLKESIEEWHELNYCQKIRSANAKLLCGIESDILDALNQIQELTVQNPINRSWIGIAGLINIIVSVIANSTKSIKRMGLSALTTLVKDHPRNKERIVEYGGVDQVVQCLGRNPSISEPAIDLLFEILYDGHNLNRSAYMVLTRESSAIPFLVTLLRSSAQESDEKARAILLSLCDKDEANIVRVAAAGWYNPLISLLRQGPELSRLSLAKSLLEMELVNENLEALGEEGIICPLVGMISGNLESKAASLGVLAKLSTCQRNKKFIAEAGAVPLVLDLLFSCHISSIVRESCSIILQQLVVRNGTQFLVDGHGISLDLQHIMTNLLGLQQNPNLNGGIRRPALGALLGICRSREGSVQKAVSETVGVSRILPLLADSNQEIQETAIDLVLCFCDKEPKKIVEYLLLQGRLLHLVGLLAHDNRTFLQVSVLGIFSSLPSSEPTLTHALFKLDALPIIFKLLKSQNLEVRENALGAILSFTNPSNLEMQRRVVELDIYPVLVDFLQSGTETVKARSCAIITNLSKSTPKLSLLPLKRGFMCMWPTRLSICEIHRGVCDVSTTFCLLKANALPMLVKVLEDGDKAAHFALEALATLVYGEMADKGVRVLDDAGAIYPILDLLERETPAVKEEALNLLEKVFMVNEMVDLYGIGARHSFVALKMRKHENVHLRRRAHAIIAQLDSNSKLMSLV